MRAAPLARNPAVVRLHLDSGAHPAPFGCPPRFCVSCGARHTPDVEAWFESSRGAWRITCEHCRGVDELAWCEACGARRAPEDAHVQLERERKLFEMEGLLWKRGRHLSGWARRCV